MTLEKTAGPSQNPGMKTRVGLDIVDGCAEVLEKENWK